MALDKDRIRDLAERYGKVSRYLLSVIGEGTAEDDELSAFERQAMNEMGAADSRGRRYTKPPSAAELAMFETSIGIPRRRIRNLGDS